MAELEQICADVRAWVHYEGESESETIGVYARCPECGRYLKHGKLLINNFMDKMKLTGWTCKKHGEVEPFFDRWDND